MPQIKYCNYCAGTLELSPGEYENILRLTCRDCGAIVYENPDILVSCFVTWEQKVLWMKRATQPYKGQWGFPGGFMEIGESPHQAAARELFEETGAVVDPDNLLLFQIGHIMDIDQIYLVFRGTLEKPDFHTSEEAEEVALFSELDAPWDNCANPEAETAVRAFYRDLARNNFRVYEGELNRGMHRWRHISKK